MAYWLVKSDPETYSFDDLAKDGKTIWDGVRNFQARNNLAQMLVGDIALVYHSNIDKAIMGIAEITKESFADPTSDDIRWLAVEIKYISKFAKPITLEQIKAEPKLKDIGLIKQSRLSVMPLSEMEYTKIIELSK